MDANIMKMKNKAFLSFVNGINLNEDFVTKMIKHHFASTKVSKDLARSSLNLALVFLAA